MGRIFNAKWSAPILVAVLLLFYMVIPLTVEYVVYSDPYWTKLSIMAAAAAWLIVLGYKMPFFDRQFTDKACRLRVRADTFHGTIWFAFIAVAVTIVWTADKIPIVAAFTGATAQELSEQRADFLKMRDGWEIALNYANAMLTSAIVPFSLAALFVYGHRLRWYAFAVFLIYCQLSLEKVLFLKVILPILYLVAIGKLRDFKGGLALIASTLILLYINTELSRGTQELVVDKPSPNQGVRVSQKPRASQSDSPNSHWSVVFKPFSDERFFTAQYRPESTLDQLGWRLIAVPVFTAGDSLKVFDREFRGVSLNGATSTLLSAAMGAQRVPFEAMVHGYQFSGGAVSPTGRSNSAYFIEAFINFGWLGVIAFSIFIGQSLRWFRLTRDPALESVWPLYVINLFQSGLIGNLLSNAFGLFFIIGLFVKVDYGEFAQSPRPRKK